MIWQVHKGSFTDPTHKRASLLLPVCVSGMHGLAERLYDTILSVESNKGAIHSVCVKVYELMPFLLPTDDVFHIQLLFSSISKG